VTVAYSLFLATVTLIPLISALIAAEPASSQVIFWRSFSIAVPMVIGLLGSMFLEATTVVTDEYFEFKFRYGWVRTKLFRHEIASHQMRDVSQWWGLGVRGIPGGWLWRIWGRSCVEIHKIKGGKRLVIGTDDPEGLSQALSN
tara:strand:+ start:200 stop:628 length:429 start_codon:yes stop_codon:yes gene_type:complete